MVLYGTFSSELSFQNVYLLLPPPPCVGHSLLLLPVKILKAVIAYGEFSSELAFDNLYMCVCMSPLCVGHFPLLLHFVLLLPLKEQ